ncbi:hypothetical protein COCNU_09G000850 [Cocos nucifera]|uniref:Uncharacterized protein n=1 Tax=Cocos nucifera TaxID=13894 RepID=A0A8K0IIT1_COCNU|nr:hypothetical protein COCNU_09G000850 [Cocos nucifera]
MGCSSEMDVKAVEMLSKGLQAHKKKGTTFEGPTAKEAKVDASTFVAPTGAATTIKVVNIVEVIPTAKVSIAVEDSVPLTSASSLIEDPAPYSPIGREEGEKKKKGKRVIMKVHQKACPSGSNGSDDSPREDPFSDLDLVRDLIDKFVLPEVVDQMANLDYM